MSVNRITLLGNVGSDPDVKTIPGGSKVANFTLATSERGYTLQNGTQVPERVEWHNVVCWNGPATIVESYVKKGSKLFIEGKIRTRSYDDKQGVKRYVTEVHVETIELLDGRKQSGQAPANQTGATPQPTQTVGAGVDPKDDLPF